jgi:hypothetical protein
MKQYRVTSQDINQSSDDDCYLDPKDPIQELKILSGMGGINGQARLQEYKLSQRDINISHTANNNAELMKQHDIKPGTPEWFKLWFSKPYLTGEKRI